jgi:hypothetical protein
VAPQSLAVTNASTIIAFAECDRSGTDHDGYMGVTRSTDGGASWAAPGMLLGYGSPAALYAASTNTLHVLFGEGSSPHTGAPYQISVLACGGGTTHWRYDAGSKHLLNGAIAPPGGPLGPDTCEGAVPPTAGHSVGVGTLPDDGEPCPPADSAWQLDNATGQLRNVNTGLCLTVPERKSAILMPCKAGTQGQKFVWTSTEPFEIKLAPGEYRAGRCLGFRNSTATLWTETELEPQADLGASHPTPCFTAQYLACNATRLRDVRRCNACLDTNSAALKVAQCTPADLETFCGGEPGPAPRGPGKPPPGTNTVQMTSTDDGLTWSKPTPLLVNNTWGPHYAGNDVAHGVQMRAEGPHQNRLVMARRYDCKQSPKAPQTPANPTWDRSFVLYSDDGGKTVRGVSFRSKSHAAA